VSFLWIGMSRTMPSVRSPAPRTVAMRSVERWLSTAPTAPAIARRQVAATLAEWRLEGLVDDAQVVASELTANAVTASTGPGVDPDDRFLRFIGLRLSERGRRLIIEVFDAAPGTPTLHPADALTRAGAACTSSRRLRAGTATRPRPGQARSCEQSSTITALVWTA
jgi:hypothetical protein